MKRTLVLSGIARALFLTCLLSNLAVGADWPDLAQPARAIGGGEHDAAVVVGIERYFAVPGVTGAKLNASAWYEYLAETRGVPPQNMRLLTNEDATREAILESARAAAGLASKGGTLWFVYIGHGAPTVDGKDGLLVGVDAQQKAASLQTRSVRRGELLKALSTSPAGSIRVVLDACFSGRGQDGASIAPGLQPLVAVATSGAIDPRMVVLMAAQGNQFAGALPGADRPAFSYLVLGGLRGWAADKNGRVTAGSLWRYAKNALAATLRGRDQTPDLMGIESAIIGVSAVEKGPNLAKMAEVTAGAGVVKVPPDTQATSGLPAGKTGIEWVTFKGGSFMMGADNVYAEPSDSTPEQPRHRVVVPRFQIAKTLVTNKQYKACVDDGACTPAHVADGTCNVLKGSRPISIGPGNLAKSFQGDDKPAVCVDWEQARVFSQWAGGRLPTEAEWEYAARGGGKEQKYPWGNKSWTCARATDNFFCPNNARPMPVCSKPAGNTQQGLCDMAGKVAQWTQDWYHDTYVGAPDDGSAWEDPIPVQGSGDYYGRVTRGSTGEFCSHVAYRGVGSNRAPNIPAYDIGFRPAR